MMLINVPPGWLENVPSARQQIEQKRRSLDAFKASRRQNPTSPRRRGEVKDERFAGVVAELSAAKRGADLGKRFGGDPWRACLVRGIEVRRVDLSALNILGRYVPTADCIELHDGMDAQTAEATLAHEIAHRALSHARNSLDNERCADAFGKAFLAAAPERPDEVRARNRAALEGMWRR